MLSFLCSKCLKILQRCASVWFIIIHSLRDTLLHGSLLPAQVLWSMPRTQGSDRPKIKSFPKVVFAVNNLKDEIPLHPGQKAGCLIVSRKGGRSLKLRIPTGADTNMPILLLLALS